MESDIQKLSEMAKEGFMFLAELAKQNAPVVWEMARRKVLTGEISFMIGTIIICIMFCCIAYRMRNYDADSYDVPWDVVTKIVSVCLCALGIIFMIGSIYSLINLDYYTVQTIINMMP